MDGIDELLRGVRACTICAVYLPQGPRPVLQYSAEARILIAGQAPGRRVHETAVPFDDPSGERLREWMGIDRTTFYDDTKIAILPMGFCYPGAGKSGDLPPRPECAPAWRKPLLEAISGVRLTLVIGQYAQAWHLERRRKNLTETVRHWRDCPPGIIPLPHPSPRNNGWLAKNPWFMSELQPHVAEQVARALRP